MRQIFLLFYLLAVANLSIAQQNDIPIRQYNYDLMERWTIKSGINPHTSLRPYSRNKVNHVIDSAENFTLSQSEEFQLNYMTIDNREYTNGDSLAAADKPLFGVFYQYKNDFYSYKNKDFDLHVNPVWELHAGIDNTVDKLQYRNGRGIEIHGTIDDKVSFYTRATTNQIVFPGYVKDVIDSVGLVPYEGFWKEYSDDITTDFFRAFGYVDFGLTKHISAQVGYGRHFIGNGMRSMILSDFSNSYPYLRVDTEIWKFRYTNLFAELVADVFTFPGGTLGNSDYPKKYLAFHQLDINLWDNFRVGLFESIMIGRPDSIGGASLEYKYLNPIIFYRALEQQDGSDYNALVGLDFSWDLWKRARLYGQFVLDELVISNIVERNGWWSNKYGYQLGLFVVDFPVTNLDLRLEANSSRPFLYAHDDLYTSYTHYEQPLAHPLGANFFEGVAQLIYRPFPRWEAKLTAVGARYGNDDDPEFSVGRDPLKSQNLFENTFGNKIGQGITTDLMFTNMLLSYQLKHNFFIDGNVIYRNESSNLSTNTSTIVTLGFRWNMPYRNYFF